GSRSYSPATLGSGGASTCTVTLSQAAPVGGAVVSLSSNDAALSVPPSVTVASGGAAATFTATAGAISVNQTATITATYSGSKTTTISLTAPAVISSLSCAPSILS